MTCLRASRAMKYSGTSAGSATGSSRYQTTSGIASANSSGGHHLGDVLDADRGRGLGGDVDLGEALALEPVVKVSRFGLYRLARAAMAVESMPPERNEPTVTSARMCIRTESSRTSAIRS